MRSIEWLRKKNFMEMENTEYNICNHNQTDMFITKYYSIKTEIKKIELVCRDCLIEILKNPIFRIYSIEVDIEI